MSLPGTRPCSHRPGAGARPRSAADLPDPVVAGVGGEDVAHRAHGDRTGHGKLGGGGRATVAAEALLAGTSDRVHVARRHGLAVVGPGRFGHDAYDVVLRVGDN